MFRTYRRRDVTRRSGNKASGIKTGGECIIINSDEFIMNSDSAEFKFEVSNVELENLFELDEGVIAFGGYIKPTELISIDINMFYYLDEEGICISETKKYKNGIKPGTWNNIGAHVGQQLESLPDNFIKKVSVVMKIEAPVETKINLVSFDLASINYTDYLSNKFYKPFKQKTSMHIPNIYYLSTEKELESLLISTKGVQNDIGEPIVLKSCNRCSRYLPINILEEEDIIAFSLHCKKRAPCSHPLFSSYKIDNYDLLSDIYNLDVIDQYITEDKVNSFYGHQVECRACKKFYVNFALNPLRNAQQFKEDGLRRRALEVLVNTLLDRNLVHHEFEYKTKKQFTEYIWLKFNKRCFKCSKKLNHNELHLDHTMPLAYLYRLDESATCLCPEHNSQKRDSFPVDFYTPEELRKLSNITNLDLSILNSRTPNMYVVKLLKENIEWFFDVFLMDSEYQKVRDGRLTADKIYASLERVLEGTNVNLLSEYQLITNKDPKSISL